MKIYLPFLLLFIGHSVSSYAAEDSPSLQDTRISAVAGNADAQLYLGLMYATGDGVPENDKTAVMWYTKAAEQGDADKQFFLGTMYDTGTGVPENDIKAYVWWALAKANGDEGAKQNLEIVKEQMKKAQIAKAQELAAKCHASGLKSCD